MTNRVPPPIPPELCAPTPFTAEQQAYLQNLQSRSTTPEDLKRCTCTWGGSNRRTPEQLDAAYELKRTCPVHAHLYTK